MTLRRQDEWLESALRDNIKTGHANGNDHLARATTLLPNLDYEALIDKWAAVLGDENMVLCTFEPGGLREPVEQQFLTSVGAVFDPQMRIEPTQNDRLSRDCLEFLGLLRAHRRISAKYFTFFSILAEYSKLYKDPEVFRYILPPELRQNILAENADKNARIARRFFNRDDGVLFRHSPATENAPWSVYPGLKRGAAVRIGEYLADRLYEQLPNKQPNGD